MRIDDLVGLPATLTIRRIGAHGAFLGASDEAGRETEAAVLLPGAEIPAGAQTGDALEVFVYLDSEGRPIATTRAPKVMLGEVAFLEVTAVVDFGAFVDWGMPKELLVPFKEQTGELHAGARHPIGVYRDDRGRLAGTMRVSELLKDTADFELDEWVEGEAWRNDPDIGLFVIIERAYVGLVPASEPHALRRGERARFRVSNILPDKKIELSLRGHAHEELENDARRILEVLAAPAMRGRKLGDRSSPEDIRRAFGMSKKAFKRAAGRLLKQGAVAIDDDGWLVLTRAPGH